MNHAPIIFLPCLRCGKRKVAFLVVMSRARWDSGEVPCKECGALHFLEITRRTHGMRAVYDRYTRRYPREFYDDPPDLRVTLRDCTSESDGGFTEDFGPISVFRRRKRFTVSEKKAIWLTSAKRCHLCGRRWRLKDHGRCGWHDRSCDRQHRRRKRNGGIGKFSSCMRSLQFDERPRLL
jgi:hypothetical protein